MKISSLHAVLLVVLLTCTQAAWAQNRFGSRGRVPPYARPPLSPYLNILNQSGAALEFQYFQRVRPELEFRRNDAQFRSNLTDIQRQLEEQRQRIERGEAMMSPTGHATSFFSFGNYFPNGAPTARRPTARRTFSRRR